MSGTKLSKFIDDPHQKFYYTYNFDRPYDFHVELLKIFLDEEPGKQYPYIFKSVGEAPKPLGSTAPPPGTGEEPEEFDFLNEMEYGEEDTDEIEAVDELGVGVQVQEEEEEEKDEIMDEFSDNENYDSDEYGNSKEDY